MADPKSVSNQDGQRFLREAFGKQQNLLKAKLELAEFSITHAGKRGDVAERHFIDILRQYLPNRYSVDSAIVIDSKGTTSDQIDVVIYDRQYTPTLLDQHDHKYVPAEAVYAVIEVKPEFNKNYLDYAADKAASVRRLARTSVPIPHAGGIYPAKPLINIIAGLVAAKMGWANGFDAKFEENLCLCEGDRKIDCGLVVDGHSFDSFREDCKLILGPKENALIFFLFRLLGKLQLAGTTPAVDWSAYAAQLSSDK